MVRSISDARMFVTDPACFFRMIFFFFVRISIPDTLLIIYLRCIVVSEEGIFRGNDLCIGINQFAKVETVMEMFVALNEGILENYLIACYRH